MEGVSIGSRQSKSPICIVAIVAFILLTKAIVINLEGPTLSIRQRNNKSVGSRNRHIDVLAIITRLQRNLTGVCYRGEHGDKHKHEKHMKTLFHGKPSFLTLLQKCYPKLTEISCNVKHVVYRKILHLELMQNSALCKLYFTRNNRLFSAAHAHREGVVALADRLAARHHLPVELRDVCARPDKPSLVAAAIPC